MELVVTLDEPMAARVRQRAAERNQPPEEAVREMVGEALGKSDEERAWGRANQRRIALILKRLGSTLPDAEEAELRELQDAVTARLAPVDRQLVAGAREVPRRARELHDAAGP